MAYLLFALLSLIGIGAGLRTASDANRPPGERDAGKRRAKCSLGLLIFFTLINSVRSIPGGSVAVPSTFGRYELSPEAVRKPGLTLKNPVSRLVLVKTQSQFVTPGASSTGQPATVNTLHSKDSIAVEAVISFPYAVNEKYAGRVLQGLGTSYQTLLLYAADSTTRLGPRKFSLLDIIGPERETVQKALTGEFRSQIADQLATNPAFKGLSRRELGEVFLVGEALIGDTTPPKPIQEALQRNFEREQELKRQKVQQQIAEAEATRRQTEGNAIRNFAAGMNGRTSTDLDPKMIDQAVRALDVITRARACEQAVANGQPCLPPSGSSTVVVPALPAAKAPTPEKPTDPKAAE